MSKSIRTANIQFIRLILITGVVAVHAGCQFLGAGNEIVSFFFIVSGFLFKSDLPGPCYFWNKVKRIYPVYILFFLILILGTVLTTRSFDVVEKDIWWHLLLLQSFNVGNSTCAIRYLSPAWFLSSLLFCYFIAPTLKPVIRRMSKKICLLVIVAAFAVGYAYLRLISQTEAAVWLGYINPVFRFGEYSIGMMLHHSIEDSTEKHCAAWLGMAVLIAYFLLISFQIMGQMSGIFHVLIIAFVFCFRNPIIDRLMANKVILWLASFGLFIYLGHYPMLKMMNKFGFSAPVMTFLSICLSICIGYVYRSMQNKITVAKR